MRKAIKEKILFNRLEKQDRQAFAEAYDLYVEKIYRFVFFKVGNVEEAQDLTSEVFLKTWNYFCTGKTMDSKTLPALIYRVARNAVIDHYRQSRHDISIDIRHEDGEEQLELVDQSSDLPAALDASIDQARLRAALDELKDEYREIIIMRYIDELTIEEIADILEKSKGNVRVLTFRALEALKAVLTAE